MKFSEQWLREWINPAVDTAGLAEQLTMAGLEVDSVEPVASAFSGVVVAEITAVKPHPDADKLQVCEVYDGTSRHQVVCGAPNARQGLRAPFAAVGAVLPGDFQIKRAKLRGVESHGMLCSAAELGLSDDSDGLLPLPADAPVGADLRSALALDDYAIEVDLTPNRGDCLGIRGIARELAALNGKRLMLPEVPAVEFRINDEQTVHLDAPHGCARYAGRIVRDVDLSVPTPLWMVERLRRSGIRSIDIAVDITNYVMLETGQPLHAFDLEELQGALHVRFARDGETLTLLDGREIKLDRETLVIADEQKVLALAGIMGGEHSGVSRSTRHLFLEAAWFAPLALAGKARQYGLHTDASHRFERGTDPAMPRQAIERATQLLLEIAGGKAGPVVEVSEEAHLPKPARIELRKATLDRMLGVELDRTVVEEMLARLDIVVTHMSRDGWTFRTPVHRSDLHMEVDLVEEVARHYGYDRLPVTRPLARLALSEMPESALSLRTLRQLLVSRGYREVISYSFVDGAVLQQLEPELEGLMLANPIASDLSTMRTTMLAGLLKGLAYNQKRQHPRVRLFESGLVFRKIGDEIQQLPRLAGVLAGPRHAGNWLDDKNGVDFFDCKGHLEELLALTPWQVTWQKSERSCLHPGQAAELMVDGQSIGYTGALHPRLIKQLKLNGPVYVFELCLTSMLKGKVPEFLGISRFPEVRRDLALLVDDQVAYADISRTIVANAGPLLIRHRLFDVYRGDRLEAGKQSLAISMVWRHADRTLRDDEIDEAFRTVVDALEHGFAASMRS